MCWFDARSKLWVCIPCCLRAARKGSNIASDQSIFVGWSELQGWKLRRLVSVTRKRSRKSGHSKDLVFASLKELVVVRKRASSLSSQGRASQKRL